MIRMKKVLLVDDESYMLELLKQLIPWEFYGFFIVGTAENAADAMRLFHREKPDVIITDICMENISGIEFLMRIRMQDAAVKVIIISAYDKFEYAQKALKLNVNGYLLKPVSREELINTLIEVQSELDSREDYQDRIQYLQDSLDQLRRKYMEEQLLRLYQGELSELPREIVVEGFWCVLSIRTIIRSEIVFLEQDIKMLEGVDSYILFAGDGLFAVFCRGADPRRLKAVLEEVRRKYCEEEKGILCGASRIEDQDLSALCQESKKALNALFYQDNGFFRDRVERFPEHKKEAGDGGDIREEQCAGAKPESISREQFMLWIIAREQEKCRNHLRRWEEEVRGKRADREKVARELKDYLEWMKDGIGQDEAEEFGLLLQRAGDLMRFSEVRDIWEKGLWMTERGIPQQGRNSVIIGRAQEYMKNHCCREEFSIEELAEYLRISKSYLSRIYKNETGESVWNFVMRVRITRAKELLVSTDDTNFAIARAIGYSSEYHFSRAFSKMVGVSPSVYKKMYMNLS